jgi:SAM-dependent methyltransferase
LSEDPKGFTRYYSATIGRPPRPTLTFALDRMPEPGFAVDLGCGNGRDTVELLRRGWQVLAIDSEPEAIALMEAREDLPNRENLQTLCAKMEEVRWPDCDLVNCSFALPFCPPERFPSVWQRIIESIREGGRFAGHLFGPHDDWARDGLTIVTRPALDALFAAFELEHLEEEDADGETAPGKKKHWHIFHIVAKKLVLEPHGEPVEP